MLVLLLLFWLWLLLLILLGAPPQRQGGKKLVYRLVECSPPRKSLVKGERFMRNEGKPELTIRGQDNLVPRVRDPFGLRQGS